MHLTINTIGQEDTCSWNQKWLMIQLSNGFIMRHQVRLTMLSIQVIFFRTIRVNWWQLVLIIWLHLLPLSSHATKESGSTTQKKWLLAQKKTISEISSVFSILQNPCNTSQSAQKTWCFKNPDTDGWWTTATKFLLVPVKNILKKYRWISMLLFLLKQLILKEISDREIWKPSFTNKVKVEVKKLR